MLIFKCDKCKKEIDVDWDVFKKMTHNKCTETVAINKGGIHIFCFGNLYYFKK